MKILNGSQLRQADAHTIVSEPISSLELMERAAQACSSWIQKNFKVNESIAVICGPGNNGGDGLAIARILQSNGFKVDVFVLDLGNQPTADFKTNLNRLNTVQTINEDRYNIDFSVYTLLIDSIFGSGLSRPIQGLAEDVISRINEAEVKTISIDLPSGLFCDNRNSAEGAIVQSDICLTLELPKLALLLPENQMVVSDIVIIPIGLDKSFIDQQPTDYQFVDHTMASSLYLPRNKYAHKGNYGHAQIVAGSYGKMGAAVLSTKACLRVGAGLVSATVPKIGYQIMQTSIPEAMIQTCSEGNLLSGTIETSGYTLGVGPGIGKHENTARLLQHLLRDTSNPMVIDADAINILAENKAWIRSIPDHSILTPHPKELERLIGGWKDDYDKLARVKLFCKNNDLYVVIKGAHTAIVDPENTVYFNATGNPGMATAGSGDVLTGIITGLLTQGYSSLNATLLGVYLHGLAGDLAAQVLGQDALIASDIIDYIGKAFKRIQHHETD